MARGHIRQRSQKNKNAYTIYVYLGVDPDTGKKKYITEVVHTGKRDAEKRLTELLKLRDTGEYVKPSKETMAQFLEQWYTEYAETRVRSRTQDGYRGNLDRYIIPALGKISLDKLTTRRVESFLSDIQREGLSARTAFHCYRLIFQSLKWGVRIGLLARNVAEEVDPPRPKRYQPRILGWHEVLTLLGAAQTTNYYNVYLITVLTGLRRSEVLALQWQDLQWHPGVLAVNRALVQRPNGERVIGPPKSGKSRTVVLPEQAVRCFGMMYESRNGCLPDDLIFCRSDGSELLPDTVSKEFAKVARSVGLKGVRFHDLRHAHATLLLQDNVHLKIVSERLGHGSIAITADLYSHVLPSLQEEAAKKLSERLEAEIEKDLQMD